MIELIGKTFVTVCAFLAVFALLVGAGISVIGTNALSINQQSAINQERMLNTFSPSQVNNITKNWTLLSPINTPASSITVGSWLTVLASGYVATDTVPLTYIDNPNVLVYLIQEYDGLTGAKHMVIYAHQEWGGFLGLFISSATQKIDVNAVVDNWDSNNHWSDIDIQLSQGYTVLIKPDSGTNLINDWNTHSQYNISVGQTILNYSAVQSGDVLAIIGQVMTFTIPNVGFWVNGLLACVLVPTYAILIFFTVRSLIPLLGG